MSSPRVIMCLPTHDQCASMFAYDLAMLSGFTTGAYVGKVPGLEGLGLNIVPGTYIDKARQQLAELALQEGADWLFWLDSDMRFPKDALVRLLSHGEPFVGINYPTRGLPIDYTAAKVIGDHKSKIPQKLATQEDSTGLEAVETMGFGVTLIHRAVFEVLHDPYGPQGPWFQRVWQGDPGIFLGEDTYFCRLARAQGYTPMVDHDLSMDCAHIGSFEYQMDHVWAVHEAHDAGVHREISA